MTTGGSERVYRFHMCVVFADLAAECAALQASLFLPSLDVVVAPQSPSGTLISHYLARLQAQSNPSTTTAATAQAAAPLRGLVPARLINLPAQYDELWAIKGERGTHTSPQPCSSSGPSKWAGMPVGM